MTLTKRDLVIRISSGTGLKQQHVLSVVQRTLDHIAEALAKGDKVELRNFGVFEVKIRKARALAALLQPQWRRLDLMQARIGFDDGREVDRLCASTLAAGCAAV